MILDQIITLLRKMSCLGVQPWKRCLGRKRKLVLSSRRGILGLGGFCCLKALPWSLGKYLHFHPDMLSPKPLPLSHPRGCWYGYFTSHLVVIRGQGKSFVSYFPSHILTQGVKAFLPLNGTLTTVYTKGRMGIISVMVPFINIR